MLHVVELNGHKINLSLDSNLKMLYEQESNILISLHENRSQEQDKKKMLKNSCLKISEVIDLKN